MNETSGVTSGAKSGRISVHPMNGFPANLTWRDGEMV